MLYIASDHGGFELKTKLVLWLSKEYGDRIADLGPAKLDPKDDYPKFAAKVATAVASWRVGELRVGNKKLETRNPQPEIDLGILLCRSGQGVCIAANKFPGIRAALAWNEKTAKASRHDDHANVLCLPSDYISFAAAKAIVKAWLQTPYGNEARHKRRIKEISKLESAV